MFRTACSTLIRTSSTPSSSGWARYAALQQVLYPGRRLGALFLAYSSPDKQSALSNQFTADQVKHDSYARGFMFVGPDDDPDFVRSEARRLGADGFKVYHDRVPQADTWNADIPQYMPEWLAEIADGFLWLRPEIVAAGRTGGVSLDPTLIGIENLGSLKHFC